MSIIQDIVDQLQAEVRDVAGIRAAPDEPPDSMNHFPFAVCHARSGHYHLGTTDQVNGIHEIWLEVHIARTQLDRDVQAVMDFGDTIPMAIWSAYEAGTLTALKTFQGISYEFGPMLWGGVPTLGFRFTIEGVKTQDGI